MPPGGWRPSSASTPNSITSRPSALSCEARSRSSSLGAASDGMAGMAATAAAETPAASRHVAIVGATILDMTGRAPIRNGTVLVTDGRIAAAGPSSRVPIPPQATVVRAAGKTVMPGLWDMHAHFEQVEWGPIYLAAGVTTVRDVGNELEFIAAVRDAVASGAGLGPRMLLAGIVDGPGPRGLGVTRAATPEEGRAWVRPVSRCRLRSDQDLQLGHARRPARDRGRSPQARHDRHRPCARQHERVHGDRCRSRPDQPRRVHAAVAASRTLRRSSPSSNGTGRSSIRRSRCTNCWPDRSTSRSMRSSPASARSHASSKRRLNGFGSPVDTAARQRARLDDEPGAGRAAASRRHSHRRRHRSIGSGPQPASRDRAVCPGGAVAVRRACRRRRSCLRA